MTRAVLFGRFGLAEDPRGLHVTWNDGTREHLATVVGVYRREYPASTFLRTRYFCGDDAPDVSAGAVRVLVRTFEASA